MLDLNLGLSDSKFHTIPTRPVFLKLSVMQDIFVLVCVLDHRPTHGLMMP